MSMTQEKVENFSESNVCPHCGAAWGKAHTSFCGECGYSQQLGREGNTETPEHPIGPSQVGMVLFFAGIVLIPLAVAVARCCTWEANNHFTWLIWLSSIGGAMALVGHVMAWCVCVGRSGMELTDIAFAPLRIWGMIFRGLPKGIAALCLFGFGLTTLGSAGLCFGIDYETIVRTRPADTREQLLSLIETVQSIGPDLSTLIGGGEALDAAQGGGIALLSDDKNSTAGSDVNGLSGSSEEETSPVSLENSIVTSRDGLSFERRTTSCLIIGYTEDTDGELLSLVLAVPGHETIRYAGTVPIGAVDAAAFSDLVERSLSMTLPQPLIDCPVNAVWLRPDAVCRVEFDGWSESHELKSPRILEVTQHLSVVD